MRDHSPFHPKSAIQNPKRRGTPYSAERATRPARRRANFLIAAALVLLTTGCLHRHRAIVVPPPAPANLPRPAAPPARPPSVPPSIVQGQEGIASWYGPGFNGKSTSSGETYNMYAMTAAHRTLPFGTRVLVRDLENGRSAEVRINDRGPFVAGRIIDLSYAAAQAMGMNGTALVRLEILGLGPNAEQGIYAVQVGAFLDPNNAERLRRRMGSRFGPVNIQVYNSPKGAFQRVRVGQLPTEAAARELARQLRQANMATETFVVRLN